MQEADRRDDHGGAGEEHFFAAGTDMHRAMPWLETGGVEVAKQPAGRFLKLVDAAARVDQHQLVARVDKDSVDLQSHWARRLERGCEQASCVLGPVAPQRFGWECERAVADDGDLDGAELEAVEA